VTPSPLPNPLLEIWRQNDRGHRRWSDADWRLDHRGNAVTKMAWAIPNPTALTAIAAWGPIVEMGAGLGYWAAQLRGCGADVVAYDEPQPGDRYLDGDTEPYFPVELGGPARLLEHGDRTLFLCWPPYARPMALDALFAHAHGGGTRLAYVGEGHWGCTGDDLFHEVLNAHYTLVREVDIPQWDGLHDSLYLYERKPTSAIDPTDVY
jgi:hypothetical protein